MEVTRSHTYEAPIGAVLDMLADADAVTHRYAGMGHREITIDRCERGDDTLVVVSSRVVEVDLPGFAKKVFSPSNTMTQTDEWHADGDRWSGTFTVDVAGAPIETSGTMSLTPEGDRTVHQVTVTVKVKVPLVGGRITDWVAKNEVPETLEAEFQAGDDWLSS